MFLLLADEAPGASGLDGSEANGEGDGWLPGASPLGLGGVGPGVEEGGVGEGGGGPAGGVCGGAGLGLLGGVGFWPSGPIYLSLISLILKCSVANISTPCKNRYKLRLGYCRPVQ